MCWKVCELPDNQVHNKVAQSKSDLFNKARKNLNLRNRLNCKTLGYSKSAEMHDRFIDMFIEREH